MFQDRYSLGVRLPSRPIAEARPVVEAALKAQGFGILTEIDVAATLKAKLDIDRPPYLILGACNPGFAHRALSIDPAVGTLLPCNVVLRADADTLVVEAMDPAAAMSAGGSAELAAVADEVRAGLQQAVTAIEAELGG